MSKRIIGRIGTQYKRNSGTARIDLHAKKGIALHAPAMKPGNPTGKGGGKRGKVSKWSTASRRRMRELLLTQSPLGREEVAVTLTIPGPPIPPKEAKEVFKKYSRAMDKADICAVWRIELQPRGQLHWHLLAGIQDGSEVKTIKRLWENELIKMGWVEDWLDDRKHGRIGLALEEGPDYCIDLNYVAEPGEAYPGQVSDQVDWVDSMGGPRPTISFKHRMMMPGAHQRACQVDRYDGRPNWLRYMQDHATKHKQEQIPDDIGRHWGVIRRKAYSAALPDDVCSVTDKEYYRILRWLQRLATPRIQDGRDPFGRRAGYRINRGRFGRSIWFSNPDTIRRMIDLARDLS